MPHATNIEKGLEEEPNERVEAYVPPLGDAARATQST
jgi:hypothetical protein